jgi:glutaminase
VWLAFTYKRLAKIGLAGGIVSIVALVLAGAVWAAGINPTGVCGGG